MFSLPHKVIMEYGNRESKGSHKQWGMFSKFSPFKPRVLKKSTTYKPTIVKELSKRVFLDEMKSMCFSTENNKTSWKVLVLSPFSCRVISNCCSMSDLVSHGITLVEDLGKLREPLPFLEAVYILEPRNDDAMKLVLQDLEAKMCPYKALYLLLLDACPDYLIETLAKTRHASRVKALKEINLCFIPYETHVYLVQPKLLLNNLYYNYNGNHNYFNEVNGIINEIATQIASLCACLGEYPSIRYRCAFANNADLAVQLKLKLDEHKLANPALGEGYNKNKSQILILDRGFDVVSPIVHELTFEAMIHDVLEIKGNVFEYVESCGRTRKVYLDAWDQSWSQIRHMHIAIVSKKLPEDFHRFMESRNIMVDDNKHSSGNLRDLRQMIQKLPEQHKAKVMFASQMQLAENCLHHYSRIHKLVMLEQCLATGFNADGEKLRDVMEQLKPILLESDETATGFSKFEKLRVIMLYILYKNGVTTDSLDRLLTHGRIDKCYKKVLENLTLLSGGNMISNSIHRRSNSLISRKHGSKGNKTQLPGSRWVPVLKDVVENALTSYLSPVDYPYLVDKNRNAAVRQPSSSRYGNCVSKLNLESSPQLPRLIIFVVGGMTYSEIRSVYEANREQTDWEILIGSTDIITPTKFVNMLETS